MIKYKFILEKHFEVCLELETVTDPMVQQSSYR